MKKEEILSSLVNHTKLVHFGVEQDTIYDRLSKEEIREFLTSIVHHLPNYPETIVEETNYYCLNVFSSEDKKIMLNLRIRELMKLRITEVINKEQYSLLILYLIIDFIDTYKTNIIKELNKASKYILSYVIPSSSFLYREIEDYPVVGKTYELNESFIRIQQVVDLIPTRKTIKKFSNYLYSFKNN